MSKSRLISGRLKKRSGAQLDPNRYGYLDASQSEPDLGLPSSEGAVLVSSTSGHRTWTTTLTNNTLISPTFQGTATSTGPLVVSNLQDSSSPETGALTIAGGVGIKKDLQVGGSLLLGGALVVTTATINTYVNPSTVIYAGTDTAVNAHVGNVTIWSTSTLQSITARGATTPSAITISNLTSASNTTTGALQVSGGAGIGGDLYVGGNLYQRGQQVVTTATVQSLTTSTLADVTQYGATTGDAVKITNTTNSLSTSQGALVVTGGVGIGGNLYIAGEIVAQKLTIEYTTITTTLVQTDDIIKTLNTTDASSTNSGALQVAGGIGVGGNIYSGGHIYSGGQEVLTTASIGSLTAYSSTSGYALSFNTSTLVLQAVTAQTSTYAAYAYSFNTGTLVAHAVLADTATNAAYAYSFNTSTLVAHAVLADTATNAAYAYSFNTGTLVTDAVSAASSLFATTSGFALSFDTSTLVLQAVSAQTSTYASYAYSFNTGTLVAHAVLADTATNAAYAYSFNTSTLVRDSVSAQTSTYASYAYSFNTSTLVTDAVSAASSLFATTSGYAQSFNTSTLVSHAVLADTATNAAYAYSFNTGTLVLQAVTAQTSTYASYAFSFNTSTLVAHTVLADTATNAAYAYSFNTSTLVTDAVSAASSLFATTSGYALSFNTGTLVLQAVTAQTSTYASYAFSFNTGTLVTQATYADVADLALNLGTGTYSIVNTTEASSTDSGALKVAGGVGIGGNLYVGDTLNVANTSYVHGSKILTAADLQTVTHTATYITNNPGSVPGLTTIANTTTVYGTYDFGTVSDVWTFNDYNTGTNTGYYSIHDAATQPAFIVYVGFEGITEFNRIVLNINYTQNSGHTQDIDIYNYVQNQWDTFTTYSGSAGWFEFILGTIDSTPYISAGKVTLRVYHVNFGNTSHRTWIDYVALEKSIQGGQGVRGATGATGAQGVQGLTTSTTSTFIFFNTTNSLSTNSGAVVAYGGVGIGKDLYVGGIAYVNGSMVLTTATVNQYASQTAIFAGTDTMVSTSTGNVTIWNTSTLQSVTDRGNVTTNTIRIDNTLSSTSSFSANALYVAGGIGGNSGFNINGDGYLHGNLKVDGYITGTNVTLNILSANSATFYGDATGAGALYAGVLGFTPFPQTIVQIAGDDNAYMELNVQNVNAGNQASTDIVASADSVTANNGFIDMGITSSGWDGTQPDSFGDNLGPNDGYILVGANSTPGWGDLALGTLGEGTNVRIIVAGNEPRHTTAIFNTATTQSISTETGAFVLYGGAGIGGNLYAGGSLNASSLVITEDGSGNQYALTMKGSESGDQWAFTVGSTAGNNNITSLNNAGDSYAPFTLNGSSVTIGTIGVGATSSVTIDNNGKVSVIANTAASSTDTGALVVVGGVGIGGNLYVQGEIVRNGINIGNGYTGSQGLDGNFGGATFGYYYSVDTNPNTAPSTGTVEVNSLAFTATSILCISSIDYYNVDNKNYLMTVASSTNIHNRGYVKITSQLSPGIYTFFKIIGDTLDSGSYVRIPVEYVSGNDNISNTLADHTAMFVTFAQTGDLGYVGSKGDIGYTGSTGYTGSAGTSITILGSVSTYTALPGWPGSYVGNIGDAYITTDTGHLWLWTIGGWTDGGQIQGYTGSKGDIGYDGSKGDPGPVGPQGDLGYTGSYGPQGTTGPQGPQGPLGYSGSKGDAGTSVTIKGSVSTYTSLPGYPSSYGGASGDGYITADTGHLWVWGSGSWLDVGEIRGPQGSQGYTGPQGPSGTIGPQGPQGPSGPSGAGYTGSTGGLGYTGSFGPQGPQGPQGLVGYSGSIGDLGYTGSIGYVGSQGATGEIGPTGPSGPQGYQGPSGPSGVSGPQGELGYTGSIGPQGPSGPSGPQSTVAGPQGPSGPQGVAGTSVTIVGSVNTYTSLPGYPSSYTGSNGDGYITSNTGHLWVWGSGSWTDVGQIVGYTGSVGYVGSLGYTGSIGPQGPSGPSGVTGPQGPTGATGPQGPSGPTGVSGPSGVSGAYAAIGYTGSAGGVGYTGSLGGFSAVQAINTVTQTAYTLVSADAGKLVQTTNTATVTITIPNDTTLTFAVGQRIDIEQAGTGGVYFQPGVGVLLDYNGVNYLNAQNLTGTLMKVAANEWLFVGPAANGSVGPSGPTGPSGPSGAGFTGSVGGFNSVQIISTLTDTTYTLVANDVGDILNFVNTATVNVIIPGDAFLTWSIGARVDITQGGAGSVFVNAGPGVVIDYSGVNYLSSQYLAGTLIKVGINEWQFIGPSANGSVGPQGPQGPSGPSGAGYTGSLGGFNSIQQISTITTLSYTLGVNDYGDILNFVNTATVNVTVPNDIDVVWPVGNRVDISQGGLGSVFINAGAGVQIDYNGVNYLNAQYLTGTLIKVNPNEWQFIGPSSNGGTGPQGPSGPSGPSGVTGPQGTAGSMASAQQISTVTTLSYTLTAADYGDVITFSNTSTINVTVPNDNDVVWPIGTRVDIVQGGAGAVFVNAGSGVFLDYQGQNFLNYQYQAGSLIKVNSNEWLFVGPGPGGPSGPSGASGPTGAGYTGSLGGFNSIQPVNTQTVTSYTLQTSDAGAVVTFRNTLTVTVTVPNDSVLTAAIGQRIDIAQVGVGSVFIQAGSGVQIDYSGASYLNAINQAGSLLKINSNEWLFIGPSASGYTGSAGPSGPSGPPNGYTGSLGPQGPSGPSGPTGVSGPQGVGPQGPQGPSGPVSTVAGPTGPQGAQGVSGPSGPSAGPQGATGYTGSAGSVGRALIMNIIFGG
jgi:hypothetical protein